MEIQLKLLLVFLLLSLDEQNFLCGFHFDNLSQFYLIIFFFCLICTKAIFISLSHHQQTLIRSVTREKKSSSAVIEKKNDPNSWFLSVSSKIFWFNLKIILCWFRFGLSTIHGGNTESDVRLFLFARGRGLHTHLFFYLMLHSRNCFCFRHSYKIL